MKRVFFITAMLMFTLISTAKQENISDDFKSSIIKVYDNDDPFEILCNNPKITKFHGTYRINGKAVIKKADTSSEMPTEVREALASCQDVNSVNVNQNTYEFASCNLSCSNPSGNGQIWSSTNMFGQCKYYIRYTNVTLTRKSDVIQEISSTTAGDLCASWVD